ncbi:MAG TPA: hypothetical protein VK895_12020, partial [Jiangellaceae bacterium]|nr:hypothetical protein [Jiangellaceae bacterium]
MPAKSVTSRLLRPSVFASVATAAVVAVGCSDQTASPPDLGQPVPVDSPAGDSPTADAPGTPLATGAPTAEADS